jgi:hypothetical protein
VPPIRTSPCSKLSGSRYTLQVRSTRNPTLELSETKYKMEAKTIVLITGVSSEERSMVWVGEGNGGKEF